MSQLIPKHYRIIVSCHLLCMLTSLQAQESVSIAILDLESRGLSLNETAALTDGLRSEMVTTGCITVVEWGQMQQILCELNTKFASLSHLGVVNDE